MGYNEIFFRRMRRKIISYLLEMANTSPQSTVGTDDEKERIRSVIAERGLVGAANDVKWGRLLDAMRQRDGWRPSYRYKCVAGPPSGWDVEWWYHLPFPMMSVEWLDICCFQEVRRGALIEPELIDHSDWIVTILNNARFCYDVVGDIIRIHGYLPKSSDDLDSNSEIENRK